MPLVLARPRAEISLILPDIRVLLAARAGTGQRSRPFGTKVLRTWMHVGPLAPHLSLLHSGEVGKSAGHQNFEPLAHAGDAGAGRQGASHGHFDPVGSRVHPPTDPDCGTARSGRRPDDPGAKLVRGLRTADGRWIVQQSLPGPRVFWRRRPAIPAPAGSLLPHRRYFGHLRIRTAWWSNSEPRTISNLIVDQTITNPAAVDAFVSAGFGILADGTQIDPDTADLTPSVRSWT